MTTTNPEDVAPDGPVHGDAVRVTLRAQEGVFLGRGPHSIGIRAPDGRLQKYRHADIARIEVVSGTPNTVDLDRMTRAQLAELPGPERAVADVLDDWLHRKHGVTSSSHGAGMFLDLLAAEGYRVELIEAPAMSDLLAPSTD